MAFNPFNAFRKHKTVLMAAVTILSMLSFVVCSGVVGVGGDAISKLFGLTPQGRRNEGSQVATVFGEKVTQGDLSRLRSMRSLANGIVFSQFMQASQAISQEIQTAVSKPDQSINRFNQMELAQLQRIVQDRQFRMMIPGFKQPEEELRDIGQEQDMLRRMLAGLTRDNKEDEAKLIRQLLVLTDFDRWLAEQRRAGSRDLMYFGGSTKPEDLLDFMVWRKKADDLGIKLTDKDVAELVNDEALRRSPNPLSPNPEKDTVVTNVLASERYRGLKPSEVYGAIADEYRVAFAQQALLGVQPGFRRYRTPQSTLDRMPVPATPEEFHKYFVENQTAYEFTMLPVPAKAFLKQVDAKEPSPQVIESLYREYKNREYSPESDKPGFKVPLQIRVEWVSANPETAHYQALGRESLRQSELQARIGQIVDPTLGGGIGAAAVDLLIPQTPDLALQTAYKDFVDNWPHWDFLAFRTVNPTYDARAEAAAGVGQVLASSVGGAPALPSVVSLGSLYTTAERSNSREKLEQAHLAVAGVLAGTNLSPMTLFTASSVKFAEPVGLSRPALDKVHMEASAVLAGASLSPSSVSGLVATGSPTAPPLANVKDLLTERTMQKSARARATQDLNDLSDLLRKLDNPSSPMKPEEMEAVLNRVLVLSRPEVRVAGLLALGWQGPLGALPWATYRATNVPVSDQAAALIGGASLTPLASLAWLNYRPELGEANRFGYLTRHERTDLHTRYNISEDPRLQFLKDAYVRTEAPFDTKARDFANLFWPPNPRNPQMRTPHSPFIPEKLPSAEVLWSSAQEPIVYWTSDLKQPYVPTLEEAKPQVIAAWRLQEARKLAQAEAKRIRDSLPKGSPAVIAPVLREEAFRHKGDNWGDVFTLADVTRLRRNILAMTPGGAVPYEPYTLVDPDHITYPPSDFVTKALGELHQPGDTMILTDKPQATFFVTVMDSKIEPTRDQFREVYSQTPDHDGLWQRFYQERETRYRDEIVKQLRTDAGLLNAEGKPTYTISEDLRKSLEGSSEE